MGDNRPLAENALGEVYIKVGGDLKSKSFLTALRKELVPALGCTEPIAIAYASAKARDVLGEFPDKIELLCSGNIIKNVKGVMVPNANGMRGVEIAAILGVIGGNAQRELEVLEEITPQHIEKAKELLSKGFFSYQMAKGVDNLYISATVYARAHSARVTLKNHHTNIAEIMKDGEYLYRNIATVEKQETDWSLWSIQGILDFADTADLLEIQDVLDRQIMLNCAISKEGLRNPYGSQIGRTLLECYGNDVRIRAAAYAAAGSDARMGGCSMPVVINSGSGNQGMTASLPVIEYAKELGVSRDKLYRALLVSNLVAIYQKHFIGSLSAFCGAVTAACGSGAAITYLHGGDYAAVSRTIINTLATVGGIVCDGAKSSCAAKIASALDAAIMAHHMSMQGRVFQPGEGLVMDDVEKTIRNIGYMGRVGMAQTDIEILGLMMNPA